MRLLRLFEGLKLLVKLLVIGFLWTFSRLFGVKELVLSEILRCQWINIGDQLHQMAKGPDVRSGGDKNCSMEFVFIIAI